MPVFDSAVFDPVVFDTGPVTPAEPSTSLPAGIPPVTPVLDHAALALRRLPHQYWGTDGASIEAEQAGDSNTQKVMRIVLSPTPELEQAMHDVIAMRSVDNAVGVWLEILGSIVGRAREGVTDDEIYRRYVRAQIAANKSDGTIENIITVAKLVVNSDDATIVIRNEGTAAFTIAIDGVAVSNEVASVLIDLILDAVTAGVRPILEYSTAAPDDVLRWTTQGVWGTAVWARAIDRRF